MTSQFSYYPNHRDQPDHSRRRRLWSPWLLAPLAALVAVVVLAVVWTHMAFNQRPVAQTSQPGVHTLASAKCDDAQAVANLLISQGFKPGEFTVGVDKFNLSLPAAKQAGPGSFSTKPLTTSAMLIAFLESGDSAAKAAKGHAATQGSATDAQLFDPENWQGFQLLVPSSWAGNTVFVSGSEKPVGTLNSQVGDIGWVFINPADCTKAGLKLQHVALIRMGCANPQNVLPTPTTPPGGQGGCAENCSPTPVPQCPPDQHPSPINPAVCIVPKNGPSDVNVNPSVPPAVRGPGTTIGGVTPPPAVPPTDSPTGCNGLCPGHNPTPVPTPPPAVPTPIASNPPPSTPIPTPPPS